MSDEGAMKFHNDCVAIGKYGSLALYGVMGVFALLCTG